MARLYRLAAVIVAVLSSLPALAKDPKRPLAERPSTGCEWAGPDFVKLAGTDSCVKLGGSVRVEGSVSTSGSSYAPFAR